MSHTNHLNIIDLYLLIEREKSSICINKEMKKLIKKDKNLKKAEKLELVEQINDKICTSQFIMARYLPMYKEQLEYHLKFYKNGTSYIRRAYVRATGATDTCTCCASTPCPNAQPEPPCPLQESEVVQVS